MHPTPNRWSVEFLQYRWDVIKLIDFDKTLAAAFSAYWSWPGDMIWCYCIKSFFTATQGILVMLPLYVHIPLKVQYTWLVYKPGAGLGAVVIFSFLWLGYLLWLFLVSSRRVLLFTLLCWPPASRLHRSYTCKCLWTSSITLFFLYCSIISFCINC